MIMRYHSNGLNLRRCSLGSPIPLVQHPNLIASFRYCYRRLAETTYKSFEGLNELKTFIRASDWILGVNRGLLVGTKNTTGLSEERKITENLSIEGKSRR